MTLIKITCPECKHEFSPDQSLKHQLDHMIQQERNQLQSSFDEKEKALKVLQASLGKKETEIDDLLRQKLSLERPKLAAEIEQRLKADSATEITGLREELAQKQQQLNQAMELQLENERLKRDAKTRETEIRIQVEREQAEKQATLEQQITQREAARHQLKLADKEKQMADLKKQLDIAQQKAEQGSMQAQGEVLEVALEVLLQEVFRFDSILPVPKGENGADILQTVRTNFGKECGMIAFESKRTKTFSEGWITKLKEDMLHHGASHGILVTEAMPKDMTSFGLREGVWVCSFREVVGLTAAIRQICVTETTINAAVKNRDSKVHALYDYLMSREFKQRVEAIIQAVSEMKENVEKERKSMLAFWKKQEMQIDQMNFLMIDVIGSIDGLSGNALGPVRGLELGEGSEAA